MSRYAERRNSPAPPSNRYDRDERGYYRPGSVSQGSGRNGPSGLREETVYPDEDDDEDTVVESKVSTVVSTAVGTDLSDWKPPTRRRAVSFGANEVEEFNGSEAPDAIIPAPSLRDRRSPLPPSNGNGALLRAVPINRPSSRGIPQEDRRSPASRMMPPPPVPTQRQQQTASPRQYDGDQSYARPSPPPSSQSNGHHDPRYMDNYEEVLQNDRGGGERGNEMDDDDDAFTAIADSTAGTGVATDLSFEEAVPRRASAGDHTRPSFPSMRSSPAPPQVHRSPFSSGSGQYPSVTSASGFDSSYFNRPDEREAPAFSNGGAKARRDDLAPPATIQRPRSTGSLRDMQLDDEPSIGGIRRRRTPSQPLTSETRVEDSPVEKELIGLLKELQFSLALKDFHDTLQIGVQRTLVAEDGMGHAYCKVHCKKLPKHEDISKQRHLRNHWIPIAGSRWEFRTASHSVTVVFKTAALAAYEAQFTTGRR
ncbi:hypothetical protein JCM5353_000089 [Sporobolomyces roseus]